MNRFELWDKVARCRWQQHFRLLVALWYEQTIGQNIFITLSWPIMHDERVQRVRVK